MLDCRVEINTAARYARDIVLDTTKRNYSSNQTSLNDALSALDEARDYVSQNYELGDGLDKEFLDTVSTWEAVVPRITAAIEQNNFVPVSYTHLRRLQSISLMQVGYPR